MATTLQSPAFIKLSLSMLNFESPGWEQLHKNPTLARRTFLAATVFALTIPMIMYGIGVPWTTPTIHISFIFSEGLTALTATWIWLAGPSIAKHPFYVCMMVLGILTRAVIVLSSMFGPIEHVPFRNPIFNTLGIAMFMMANLTSSALGGSPSEHPVQPYETVWTPIMAAWFTCMRLMDTITDAGFCRILLTQGPECSWYGEAVPCAFYTLLGIVTMAFSLLGMLLIVGVALCGGQAMLSDSTGKWFRAAVTVNAAIMLLELGVVAITIAKIFSDMRSPVAGDATHAHLHQEVAFEVVSCCMTVASFVSGAVGLRRLLRAAQKVHDRASNLFRRSRSKGTGALTPESGVLSRRGSTALPANTPDASAEVCNVHSDSAPATARCDFL